MGIPRSRTDLLLGSVSTSRYLTITTAAAQLLQAGTGFMVLELFNVGSGNLIYGDSSIAVNSGAYIWVNALKRWENIEDDWNVYLRADSVATIIAVVGYGVP